jgi:hypothetical protein
MIFILVKINSILSHDQQTDINDKQPWCDGFILMTSIV